MLRLCACSWWTGEWSECSRSCNGGLRTRQVLCKRRISVTEEKVLDDSACRPLRPSLTEPCNNHSCPPEWLALDWSEVGIHATPPPLPIQGDLQLNRSECKASPADLFSAGVVLYFPFGARGTPTRSAGDTKSVQTVTCAHTSC